MAGHTESVSDYVLGLGALHVTTDGIEVDAVKAKVVEAEKKPAPKKTTAKTKVMTSKAAALQGDA